MIALLAWVAADPNPKFWTKRNLTFDQSDLQFLWALLILYVSDLYQQLDVEDIAKDETLRRFWFPKGYPRPTPDDVDLYAFVA